MIFKITIKVTDSKINDQVDEDIAKFLEGLTIEYGKRVTSIAKVEKSKATKQIKERLEYLRGELEAERISYGEIVELQSLAEYIEPDDVQLLESAGVKEKV